MLYKLTTKPW